MKKIFFSLLAIAAIGSCAKTEPVYTEIDSEIKLAPVTSMVTKAQPGAIDGTQYPAAEDFDVYAYWATDGAGSVFTEGYTEYLGTPKTGYGVEFTKKGDWFWGGKTPYYWPKNGSLRFAAYSPADLKHEVKHDLATDTYTVLGYTQPNETDKTFDFLLAPTSVSYTAATAVDDVDVVFEHALSWITLQAKAADATASGAFTVHNVKIDQVNTVADLTAAMPAKTWSKWSQPKDYVVGPKVEDQNITTEVVVLDKVDNGTVIIPQATTTVTIEYTQNAINGSAVLENQVITVPLILDAENTPWEPGKHYIYTLIFGLDEILITPSVVDWEDVEVPVIDATATEVSTAAELISAVAAGRNVRLVNDVVVDAPVKVNGGDVLVELNGYSVKSEGDVFEVAAGTLSINGPGLVEAATANGEPYCAVWAYGDAVVNIYGGEYKAGYPAGDYNDLIYAKDNAKINVYGGKFYNSGKENSFVLNLKDNTKAQMVVYGGSFEKFNPANNASEGAGTNFVADGYNVVEADDWYTVYAPAESVALAADAVTYGKITVNNGVFDGGNNTVTVPENPTSDAILSPVGDVTIQNVTIDGLGYKSNGKALRGIYPCAGGNYVIKNTTVKGVTYAINVNTTAPATLAVEDSALYGWVSYGDSTTASFEGVTFGKDAKTNYGHLKPYTSTTFTGCTFENGYEIDFEEIGEGEVLTFVNCKVGDVVLTAENVADYLTSVDPANSADVWAQANFN